MKSQEASQRYARALYKLAAETKQVELILNEVREFNLSLEKDTEVHSFFTGPSVRSENQKKVLDALFEKKNFSEAVRGFLLLLADKRRFSLLPGIVASLEAAVDASSGISRGSVESATTLFPEERQKLEATISRYTGKKAVLEYDENKKLLGGLVAQVGSFRFDDSLETQLRLMKDALKNRRAN
ncbi:MAG: ATP synthase F1 subunit delta [Oligoflexia bacterium]|nr:ATP synthase F1 subunit delta [Oligoflexia bacterium]